MIIRVSEGFRVLSENGRNMGTYKTIEEARIRLREIEYFRRERAKMESRKLA